MRILIIAPEQIPVPPVMGGSVEICIHQIAKRLATHHQVTVVSRQYSRYPDQQRKGNLTIIRMPKGSQRNYIKSVIKAIRGMSFDWIQVDNRPVFVPYVKSAFPRTPVSLYMHSLTFVSPSFISRKTARRCMSRANMIVANSQSTVSRLKAMFPSLSGKLRKVWLGVDTDTFHPPKLGERESARSKFNIGSGFTILFTGRVIPRKGIPILLNAAGRMKGKVPSVKVVIAGRGKPGYVSSLRQQAKRAGVQARFIGYIPHRRMQEVYHLADCFVCPSQQHESFGLVNVEAMASGLPIVASRNGGIKEIVKHNDNGLLVTNYRSPQAFASRLTEIAKNKTFADRLSKKARQDGVKRFGWDATVRKLSGLYRRTKHS